MTQTNKEKSILLTLMVGVMFLFYGKILVAPNSYLFSSGGDGIKNYYTYAFFIKNNKSNIEHEGMNYPYGENFMYTDCHPLQASILKYIANIFPSISNYSIRILNYALMLSFFLTAYILYLIFKALNINGYLAIIGAIGITLMSPQIYRLLGHLALSYSFVIPLTFYFLILYSKQTKLKYLIFLSLFLIVIFFTHAYLGMIAALTVFTFAGLTLLIQLKNKVNVKSSLFLLLSSIIPILSFYLFVKLTDTHLNRTTNPWGIYDHHANFSTVFLPNNGWLNPLTSNLNRPWEGWSYIGLSAIFTLIFYLTLMVKKKLPNTTFITFFNRLLLSSILILCFSMLYPFESLWVYLIEHFTIIKQFRAIGRFAWVFYFTTNILAIYLINYYLFNTSIKLKTKSIYAIMLLVAGVYIFEGVGYYKKTSKEIVKSVNLLDINQTPIAFQKQIKQINPKNYQAIISLPFFYIGSDNYGNEATPESTKNAFLFSYHLNLPMVNAYLTRTSICESKKIMQMLSKGFYPKNIKNDLKSDKPFLIISAKKKLTESDLDLINKSKIIINDDNLQIFELPLNQLFKNTANDEINLFKNLKDSLQNKQNFLVSDSNLFFEYKSFDTLPSHQYEGFQKHYNVLYEINGKALKDSTNYLARFWINIKGKNCGQDLFNGMIFFIENINDTSEWIFPLHNATSSHQIIEDWMLVEVPLKNINKKATYQLMIKGDDHSTKKYIIDDLLFYEEGGIIYKQMPNYLFKNNHKIQKFD